MSIPLLNPSFAAGELAPSLFGREDLAKAHIGLSTCRNAFISFRGGAYSRAGTAFCGYSKQTGRFVPPRVIQFQFSIKQGLCLEFGNLYMRVVKDGEFVTETATVITGATRANPGVITDVAHGYANGDWVFIYGVVGMTQLNGQTYVVAGVTANTYTLTDVFGNAIDTTAFGAYVSGGTAARIYTLVTPYADVDLIYLKFTQSADVMSLTCVNQITNTEYAPYDLARLADNNWTLTKTIFTAAIAAPTGLTAVAQSSTTVSTWYSYIVTAVDRDGKESVGSLPVYVENNDIAIYDGTNTISWVRVAGAVSYNVYAAQASFSAYTPAGALYGFIGATRGLTLSDTNIVPDFAQVPPVHSNPFARGAITDVAPTGSGSNYSQQTIGYSVVTSTGSGFAGTPIVVNGAFAGFDIQNGGEGYVGPDHATLTDSGGGLAVGTFTFSGNPLNHDKMTFNSKEWEFTTTNPVPQGFLSGVESTTALTVQSLANALNSSTDLSISVATYSASSNVLTITYKTPGADGNAYTLTAGSAPATPSGANLTGGGTAGSGNGAAFVFGPQSRTYPGVVAYFQERRAYANSLNQPDTYWLSQPGSFTNFDSRTPTVDSDAITGTPWSVQVNGIQWMVSMPGGLVVLTGSSAWQLTGSGGSSLNPQAITPASQQAQPQAYNGISATVAPIKIDYEILYLQAKGSIIRGLSYQFYTNIYTGIDLTYLSSHLFTGYTIKEMAWCEEPYKVLWAVRNDGTFLSLTYLKAQEVLAWARHDTQGQVWSVCSVTEPPVDALYMATQRRIGGNVSYMIERMDNRIWPSAEESWCVDAGLTLTMPTPNASLFASSATGAGIPTGVTGLVGGTGYSAGTTATLIDPTGSGAAVNLTIAAGIITGVAFVGGTKYTYPQLVFNDPAGTGSGASATTTLDNSATFTASSAIFSAPMVGQVIRMGSGIATITAYIDTTHVTANITSPILHTIPNSPNNTTIFSPPGTWSVTAPVTVVGGLNHLIGASVTGVADGIAIPPQVVAADGTITLGTPATAITVGLGFQVQVQSLYLESGQPTAQGRRKKIAAVTARLEASNVSALMAGSNQPDGSTLSPPQNAPVWRNLAPLKLPPDKGLGPYGSAVAPLYTGDVRVTVNGGFATPGQVALQQSSPLPLNIISFITEFLPGDTPQDTVSKEDRRAA